MNYRDRTIKDFGINMTHGSQGGNNQKFIDSHKSKLLMEIDSAEDGLELVREVERLSKELQIERNHNEDIQRDLKEKSTVLQKYIKTFGEYKKERKTGFSSEEEIVMPITESYKLYKKIFNMDEYPYKVYPGNKIAMVFEILDDSYKILSRKISKIRVKK